MIGDIFWTMNMGKWSDKWIIHPFPSMSEPEKAFCYLTDIQEYDEDHLAWLYNKASPDAIDRFFMQGPQEIVFVGASNSNSEQFRSEMVGIQRI